MADSGTLLSRLSSAFNERPTILLGVTTQELCLILGARIRVLSRAGFRVVLVSGPGELLERTASRTGVECIALPMRRCIAPLTDLVALVRLWRILGRVKPDLVEFSTPKAGLLGMIAAKLRGVPWRVYMLRGLKLERSRGFKRWILLVAERVACCCAHVVLCNSKSLRVEALALGLAPAAKLLVLGEGSSNGVDIERFSPGSSAVREQFSIPRDAPVVGFVGRLTRDKGLPELIEAFDRILLAEPSTHLLLVGWFDRAEDALDAELRRRILNHPRIHCSGFVSDTAPFYRGYGRDGSSHLARRFSQCGSGGSSLRHSGRHYRIHGRPRCGDCRGNRPSHSTGLSRGYLTNR